jgi:hypothetical protein
VFVLPGSQKVLGNNTISRRRMRRVRVRDKQQNILGRITLSTFTDELHALSLLRGPAHVRAHLHSSYRASAKTTRHTFGVIVRVPQNLTTWPWCVCVCVCVCRARAYARISCVKVSSHERFEWIGMGSTAVRSCLDDQRHGASLAFLQLSSIDIDRWRLQVSA